MLTQDHGQELWDRLAELGKFSEAGPGLTRRPFTPEHKKANALIRNWMAKAGLAVRLDAAGTLVGRKPGPKGCKTFLLGSHQDSIKNGGQYDGMLGIALPIYVLELIKDIDLPYTIEILAFADEEGVRFPTALMGPRVLAGTFDEADLALTDKDGIALNDALADFGGSPTGLKDAKRNPEEILGYLEVHIEQGPVLEDADKAVGIVTAICGIERWSVALSGQAAHAGTTPMQLRQDAFAGAAEVALMIEDICRKTEDMVGTVGHINVLPNVVNAIPGATEFSVELRASDDQTRTKVGEYVTQKITEIAEKRKLNHGINKTYAQKAVPCDDSLSDLLENSVKIVDAAPMRLMSGATHDASAMSDLCPVAMLFVRCTNGLSHHPDEAITSEDCTTALEVVRHFLVSLANSQRRVG